MPFAIFGMGVGEVEAWEQLAAGPRSLTVKNTHELYTLGVGINYAITDNVTTGLRYNHTFSSRERYDCGLPVCGIVGDFNMKSDTVTAVLEYKF
jgi:opacity protein-like surface antigen